MENSRSEKTSAFEKFKKLKVELSSSIDKLSPVISIVVIVLIGIYASVRATLLGNTFPFSCWKYGGDCISLSWEVITFYAILVPLIAIVWKQTVFTQKEKDFTEKLLQETQQLVKVAPPIHLLKYSQRRYIQLTNMFNSIRDEENITDKELEECLRLALRAMIDIAYYWDTHKERREKGDKIYSASIMRAIPSAWFADKDMFQTVLLKNSKFIEVNDLLSDTPPSKFEFYLSTEENLRTSNESQSLGHLADTVDPIIFGANRQQTASNLGLIPEAPFAFFYGKNQYVSDTSKIALTCGTDEYLKQFQSMIDNYYEKSKVNKSILSTPIPIDDSAENHSYSAVINLYSDSPNLLGGRLETCEHFVSLVSPIIVLIDSLMELFLTQKSSTETATTL
ncbi:MAG: hypothetical protein EOO53_11805 [Gammaproteobacteria bacterium]|nr:MAG: hypothetical protein EOO53_11805 [Gammaproteobacteria bacterium]